VCSYDLSELSKIAIIHLYVQGFTDADLVDFELNMTSPSVVYEQEKINLWTQKIMLANSIAASKFMSRDWIYHNILEISEDDADKELEKIMEDAEQMGKISVAEQMAAQPPMPQMPQPGMPGAEQPAAGEQPQPTGQEGEEQLPVDPEQPSPEEEQLDDVEEILAALETPSEEELEQDQTLDEIELEEAGVGRPKEAVKYGTDKHPRGRDVLGARENHNVLKGTMRPRRAQPKKSPLSLDTSGISAFVRQLRERHTHQASSQSILNETQDLSDEI
jgi:hypothetical protein